jgi:hypothetical protein
MIAHGVDPDHDKTPLKKAKAQFKTGKKYTTASESKTTAKAATQTVSMATYGMASEETKSINLFYLENAIAKSSRYGKTNLQLTQIKLRNPDLFINNEASLYGDVYVIRAMIWILNPREIVKFVVEKSIFKAFGLEDKIPKGHPLAVIGEFIPIGGMVEADEADDPYDPKGSGGGGW